VEAKLLEPLQGLTKCGRIAARLARHVEVALSSVDLTPSQYRVLMRLAEGPSGASVLASGLAVSRPSLTAVVDGLVARGLVERSSDPADRRRVGHQLTDEGCRALQAGDQALEERLQEVLGYATHAQAAQARKGLEALEEPLGAFRAARLAQKQ
jgi:long-chain acyl-CoA synthetase